MKTLKLLAITAAALLSFGCAKKSDSKSIAVFVPGICDDSPTYALLVKGVTKAVDDYNTKSTDKVELFVMEAGTNQAEWSSKLTALTAEQKYDVIISSNPSLPDLAEPILTQFPNQKYIFMDATKAGNESMYTVSYNQKEASWLSGYIGGLMSKSHKLGLVAAQEYPVMNNIIYPYYEKGAKYAVSGSSVDFRIVGNWYDATKGAEITDALISKGVDVILPICGGASQGVINSAVNGGIYITWFDSDNFAAAPGTIISCSIADQEKMSEKVTAEYLAGSTKWGQADQVGLKEGFVRFIEDNPNYIKSVPEEIRSKLSKAIEDIKSGALNLN